MVIWRPALFWTAVVVVVSVGLCVWWGLAVFQKPLKYEQAALDWLVQSGLSTQPKSETLRLAVHDAAEELRSQGMDPYVLPSFLGGYTAARLQLGERPFEKHPEIGQALADEQINIEFRSQYLQAWLKANKREP